jgi:hypothetical protein
MEVVSGQPPQRNGLEPAKDLNLHHIVINTIDALCSSTYGRCGVVNAPPGFLPHYRRPGPSRSPAPTPSEAHASGGHLLGLDDFLSTAPKSEIHTIGSDANHIGTDDARHVRRSLSHLTIGAPIRSTKGRESYEVIKASMKLLAFASTSSWPVGSSDCGPRIGCRLPGAYIVARQPLPNRLTTTR